MDPSDEISKVLDSFAADLMKEIDSIDNNDFQIGMYYALYSQISFYTLLQNTLYLLFQTVQKYAVYLIIIDD